MSPEQRAAQVKAVIELIREGKSENAACAEVGINRGTFRSAALKYLVADEYAMTLAALAETQIELMEDAIRDMRQGTIDAPMARVEIDTRKWFASKMLPRKYGDKITQEHTGANGGPIQYEALTDDQLKAKARDFLKQFPELTR